MLSDLRQAVRFYRHRPVVATVIIVTMALAIGASGAVISIVDRVLLHPVNIDNPGRVFAVSTRTPTGEYGPVTLGEYRPMALNAGAIGSLAAFFSTQLTLNERDTSEAIPVSLTTGDYFNVVNARAAIGRVYSARDSLMSSPQSQVVLSHGFWRTHFGGKRDIVGTLLRLNGTRFTIVGVMPATFTGTRLADTPALWIPLSAAPSLDLPLITRDRRLNELVPIYSVVVRLNNGIDPAGVEARLTATAVVPQADRSATAPPAQSVRLTPIEVAAIAGAARVKVSELLTALLVLVGIALFMACVNAAVLLVTIGYHRAEEFGMRIALGASSATIHRQVLLESVVLVVPGALLGIGVAAAVLRIMTRYTLPGDIALGEVTIRLGAYGFIFIVIAGVVASILSSILPARRALRAGFAGLLRGRDAGIGRARTVLLAGEVAVSLALLVGASLFLRSAHAALTTNVGFDPANLAVLTAPAPLNGRHLDNIQPYLALIGSVEANTGTRVALASHVPLEGTWPEEAYVGPLRRPRDPQQRAVIMAMATVTPNYFQVLGLPVVAGRAFNTGDGAKSPRVAIINQSAARALFPTGSPLGRKITVGPIFDYRVVGVVPDIKYMTLRDTAKAFGYVPMVQGDLRGRVHFIARSSRPRQTLAMLAAYASRLDPPLESTRLELESARIAAASKPQRLGAMLLSCLALVGLGISTVGMYGTVAYATARRSKEIGIRLALGAGKRSIIVLVLRHAAVALGFGLVGGIAATAAGSGILRRFLYRVQPTDWIAFFCALTVLCAVSAIAAVLPALRALRIDVVAAIRSLGD